MPREARERARARAAALVGALGEDERSGTLALLDVAAEIFWSTAVDLAARPADARWLIEQVLELSAVPRLVLAREVLRGPQPPPLPVEVAIEAQLALVLAFGGFDAVSLSVPAH